MDFVAGHINNCYLENYHIKALKKAEQLFAAIAYVGGQDRQIRFFNDYYQNDIPVYLYGRYDDTVPVSINILEYFLKKKSPNMVCRLVSDFYHPKVLWWKGYGVYIGSANLSDRAWFANIEAGVFYSDKELLKSGLNIQLDIFFDTVREKAFDLTEERLQEIKDLKNKLNSIERQRTEIIKEHKKNSLIPEGKSLISIDKEQKDKQNFLNFSHEWNQALEYLRAIAERVSSDEFRPKWIPKEAPSGAQADQFLHAFYYNRCFIDNKAAYNQMFHKNSMNPEKALVEAMQWWRSAKFEHRNEEIMLFEWLPILQEKLSFKALNALTENDFIEICKRVHSIRDFSRRVSYRHLDLKKPDYTMSIDKRLPILAKKIFSSKNGTRTVVNNLLYLLYDSSEKDVIKRLWNVAYDSNYKLPLTGISTFGEILGWAIPEKYPPRNGRTNKALRALGYDVKEYD